MPNLPSRFWLNLLSDYGNVLVLLLLCVLFSVLTYKEQYPSNEAAARRLADDVADSVDADSVVLVVVQEIPEDIAYADALEARLKDSGFSKVRTVSGDPRAGRMAMDATLDEFGQLDVIACNKATAAWRIFLNMEKRDKRLAETPVLQPQPYFWPDFLTVDNLRNIATQISVIAIIAVGMTMVIITGGIDLSVGSLIALSAVCCVCLIRDYGGAEQASAASMVACALGAIGLCTLCGLCSGAIVTAFRVPPFIVTLAVMLVASGVALMLSDGQSIDQVPSSFIWLGRESDFLGIPNSVALMIVLYAAAHIVMTRMTIGRYIYAVGGNAEAARLSGVPNRRVLLLVYAVSGALAGVGGIVMASQLKSGAPTYGETYELYVIAAVVVGGTSLAGGEGRVIGTLIGALDIATIQNGMNLVGIESYTQKVVLGTVVLIAVLADRLKQSILRS